MSFTIEGWTSPVIPACETQRLESLAQHGLLLHAREDIYDTFTALAKSLTQADASVLAFITEDGQWNKSQTLPGTRKISRELSIDAHLVGDGLDFLHVSDMQEDPRFFNHPRVTDGETLHAYLGVAIHDRNGLILGVLSVYKTTAHVFSSANIEHLTILAQQVEQVIARAHNIAAINPDMAIATQLIKHNDSDNDSVAKYYPVPNGTHAFIHQVQSSIGKVQNIAGLQGQILILEIQKYHYLKTVYGTDFIHHLEQQVQYRLTHALPETCFAGRLDDGEFGVYLSADLHLSQVDYLSVLRESVESPIEYSSKHIYLNINMGISTIYNTNSDLQENINAAKEALSYTGGRPEYYQEHDDEYERLLERASHIEQQLRSAVNQNAFTLVYQPIVETQTQTMMGMEALVRWRWKPTEFLSPSEFIPIAESAGLIKPLSKWILRTACIEFAGLQEEYVAPLYLSVNISPCEISAEDFVHSVFSALQEAQLHPAQLQLEITEHALMTDFAMAVAKLEQLSQAGVRIAIDDFGTGHSSLQYLQHLPVDTVKIDQSFIEQISAEGEGTPILKAIIALSHEMGIQLTAEGIEQWHQAKYVRDNDIATAQGFYYAKPKSIKDTLLTLTNYDFA